MVDALAAMKANRRIVVAGEMLELGQAAAELHRACGVHMAERKIEEQISPALFAVPTVLLCSETTADHCHRRLVCAYLQDAWGGLEAIHL